MSSPRRGLVELDLRALDDDVALGLDAELLALDRDRREAPEVTLHAVRVRRFGATWRRDHFEHAGDRAAAVIAVDRAADDALRTIAADDDARAEDPAVDGRTRTHSDHVEVQRATDRPRPSSCKSAGHKTLVHGRLPGR
jgi:hypothetical protein